MKVYLGIDPGKHTGIAAVSSDGELVLTRTVEPLWPTTEILRLISQVRYHIACAAIETQYVSVNPRATITLAQTTGRWIEACESSYVTTMLVEPSRWQSDMLSLEGRVKSKGRKHAAIDMCRELWHIDLDEHSADAALIALWLAREQK
jgi:Holliday junction resolvasome RuvABC endonuclease subunit